MPEVNGNFTYEAMPGQEMEYDENEDVNEDMGIFDAIEDNDQYDDQIDDDS